MEVAAQYVCNNVMKSNVSLVIDKFAKELKDISGKCMDVGCGPGDVTKNILLAALNPKATMIGTDIMTNMIGYANKMYGDEERLKFEVLDIQRKNLPEKYISKFDHIFSFHTLHWCHNIRQAYENIYRMLQPGKSMLISTVTHCPGLFEAVEIMAQDARFSPYMENKQKYVGSLHYSTRPHEELKEILEDIGFQVHYISHQDMYCRNTEKFLSMVTSQYTYEFLDKMPHNIREEFKNELRYKFTKKNIKNYKESQDNFKLYNEKDEADIPALYSVLIVYAQKKFHSGIDISS
ncbi:juvenile hormone acid O-methyltransferase-like [Nylanderia fulva]|uniref:juvenile hormone acid O-methyltransferase-like n=1 Tax=Nylanderia fulva TaxID=613905 RepID=UPI0010FB5FCC|nr:juvenile hormone acid O-methyltransferase-like [Nylanderia fulva]